MTDGIVLKGRRGKGYNTVSKGQAKQAVGRWISTGRTGLWGKRAEGAHTKWAKGRRNKDRV
jgi:hypothetical protein